MDSCSYFFLNPSIEHYNLDFQFIWTTGENGNKCCPSQMALVN